MTWAVALSVFSAACYAAAAVVQERLAARGHRGIGRWAASVGLTLLGATTHTVALDFAAVGVVQALGTLTLLFALPIAAVRTRTRITPAAWRDAGLTVAGLVGIMALTTQPAASATVSGDAARYLVLVTAAALVTLVVLARHASGPVLRSVLLAGASGIAFGVSSVFTKSMLVSFSTAGAVTVAVLAVAGYLLGQASYRGGGLSAPLAMVSVTNPAVAATVGVLVLGEGFRLGTTGLVLTAVAAVAASVGVIGLSRRTAATPATPTPAANPQPAVSPTPVPAASLQLVPAAGLQPLPGVGAQPVPSAGLQLVPAADLPPVPELVPGPRLTALAS